LFYSSYFSILSITFPTTPELKKFSKTQYFSRETPSLNG
jgi:hypothetical protein